MNPADKKILAIVPAFNECGNVGRTVGEIRKAWGQRVDVLVIDDGSKDETAKEAAKAGGMVVSLPFNLGIGAAVQTGFQFAQSRRYDIAVQIDGDGQHDPSFMDRLVEPLARGEADMAVGSRFLEGSAGYRSSFSRRMGISFFVHLINALTGVRINDPTSGFRAYNSRMIDLFADYYPYDFPEPEAIVLAQQARARIVELPVAMRPREAGSSSIRYFKTLYYMVKVTLAILLQMARRRRRLS
ncbi:MAG: glycosyltransferase family 2 protein [Candidatus Omnitrophica bacterium]|nr:glycosyltransferase family 2 protein [Candidatus Omnitrophota bacterium]MDE2232276.1 glycosyltransferase family 2 protein [Candidatus Omnitrophota bacterium]